MKLLSRSAMSLHYLKRIWCKNQYPYLHYLRPQKLAAAAGRVQLFGLESGLSALAVSLIVQYI